MSRVWSASPYICVSTPERGSYHSHYQAGAVCCVCARARSAQCVKALQDFCGCPLRHKFPTRNHLPSKVSLPQAQRMPRKQRPMNIHKTRWRLLIEIQNVNPCVQPTHPLTPFKVWLPVYDYYIRIARPIPSCSIFQPFSSFISASELFKG